ncbi:TonB-dependent receptor [Roseibacillus ishigakijimensis]|uniref:TonB-dependent receptor n=1 Tax=Roseibacillus ishigakijimensis TaxID=454146 RepID=A0A934RNR6_9BACT|nr:TonB-dependent receptor [Roseibacillus ishigakijimensis]MBK1834190.1 TonB-dependent receptor [Roseibacillus ishigakijimensis]
MTSLEKALQINLDPSIYGVFAEIGAGQEVANWFFRASASAGTVAKSISAYDMTMSDAIYGKGKRYVSRERVRAMLDHEFAILSERLSGARGEDSTFFSYCNTVRARGYRDTAECHGWMGLRMQVRPNGPAGDILLHVRLLDEENVDQMEALGVVGLNLIHSAFHYRDHLESFVAHLVDNIAPGRVEIDMLKFTGEPFDYIDNRICALQLVNGGLTPTAMFRPDGEVVQPAELLYKRPVLLLRGSFNPVTKLHLDMLSQARALTGADETMVEICEMSMNNLLRGEELDYLDFLDRADALQALGKTVVISRCAEFYRIVAVLRRYTSEAVGVALSIGLLNELFKDKWSQHLDGGILESFGRLLKHRVQLLVYPWRNRRTGDLVTAENFRTSEKFQMFYDFLHQNDYIKSLPCGDEALLERTPRDLQRMKEEGDLTWKNHVPQEALETPA